MRNQVGCLTHASSEVSRRGSYLTSTSSWYTLMCDSITLDASVFVTLSLFSLLTGVPIIELISHPKPKFLLKIYIRLYLQRSYFRSRSHSEFLGRQDILELRWGNLYTEVWKCKMPTWPVELLCPSFKGWIFFFTRRL